MIAPETFVGALSIALAIGIAVTAVTGHSIANRSRVTYHLRQRFGEWAAKSFFDADRICPAGRRLDDTARFASQLCDHACRSNLNQDEPSLAR